jgi:hypothetical protein
MSTRKKNPNLVAGQTIGGAMNPDFIAGVHDAILHNRLHLRPPKRLDKGEDHQVALDPACVTFPMLYWAKRAKIT